MDSICLYACYYALWLNMCADVVEFVVGIWLFSSGLSWNAVVFCSGGYQVRKMYPISFRQVKEIIEAFQTAVHFRWMQDLRCDARAGDISSSMWRVNRWRKLGDAKMRGNEAKEGVMKHPLLLLQFCPLLSCHSVPCHTILGKLKRHLKHNISVLWYCSMEKV